MVENKFEIKWLKKSLKKEKQERKVLSNPHLVLKNTVYCRSDIYIDMPPTLMGDQPLKLPNSGGSSESSDA